jgi:NADPH:quinone reductase-like Zn-dependent oxidoreductase
MRAVQITEYGDTSVLTLTEATLPDPEGTQILLDVRAAALNPLDTVLRAGWMHDVMPLRFPATSRPSGPT